MNPIEKVARAMEAESKFCADAIGPTNMRNLAKAAIAAMQPAPQWQGIEKAMSDYLGEMCGMRLKPHALTGLAKAAIAAMPVQAEPVAWRYTRTDGHFFLTPKRCRDGYPEVDGWTEEALYAGPTPPNGGSDAE